MAQNMNQANIDQLAAWRAQGNSGDLPVGWQASSSGGNSNNSASGLNVQDVVANAQKLNEFYKQQNQPVIAATEATKAPLQQRYSDLLASIKGNQQVAENRQTTTTRNMLGARGINSNLGVGATEMTGAVNPITQQYTGMLQDTTNTENIDLANIDKTIASLMAGNPESSVSTSSGLATAQQQANQFQQQLEATQKQNAIANEIARMNAEKKSDPYTTLSEGQVIIDPTTGKLIYKNPKTSTAAGEGW